MAAGVFVVRCIRDSSKSLRPIGGAQVAAGNGVGRAPRNPGKRGLQISLTGHVVPGTVKKDMPSRLFCARLFFYCSVYVY